MVGGAALASVACFLFEPCPSSSDSDMSEWSGCCLARLFSRESVIMCCLGVAALVMMVKVVRWVLKNVLWSSRRGGGSGDVLSFYVEVDPLLHVQSKAEVAQRRVDKAY